MKIGLIADVHANILALEAVLRDLKAMRLDAIYSLGDQINLGPCPRETLAMLRDAGVICLHGNHERYVLRAIAGDPAYSAVNFMSLRYNAGLLKPEEITFPEVVTVGGATLCHAMPGDDRFPIHDVDKALELLRQRTFDQPTHIICGHSHNPRTYRMGNLTVSVVGSAGCMDAGVPGMACYATAEIHGQEVTLVPGFTSYDPSPLRAMFKKSGMVDFCPVMAHVACEQMTTARCMLMPFVGKAHAMAAARGESEISRETWLACDAAFDWPSEMGTAQYWQL